MRRLILACVLFGCSSKAPNVEPQAAATFTPCTGITVPTEQGGCVESGIAKCPEGFVSDAGSCRAVLPETPCARGTMAVPGETACRPVATCPDGAWYDAPESAIHVDRASTASSPDGTIASPYAKLQDALDAAPEGATIALADGVYPEAITIRKKATILGRCPTKASIEAPEGSVEAVEVEAPAELRRIAVTGPVLGVSVFETEGVVGDQLWIHDTGSVGFDVERRTKTAAAKLSRSLVEGCGWAGVIGIGGKIALDSSVVRDIHRIDDAQRGMGIFARSEGDEVGSLRVSGSLVERVRQWGIATQDSPLDVEATLVRTVAEDAELGTGIVVAPVPDTVPKTPIPVRLEGVVVEDVVGSGMLLDRVDAVIQRLTVRSMRHGKRKSSDGFGVVIERSSATLDQGVVEQAERSGFALVAAKVTASRLLVRDVVGVRSAFGIGVYVGDDEMRSSTNLVMSDSRIDRTATGALLVLGSQASVERSVFDQIVAIGDGYGDGVTASGDWVPGPDFLRSTVTLDMVQISHAARAGVAVFGGSDVSVARSALRCTGFDLEVNEHASESLTDPVKLDDLGGSICGCDDEIRACRAQSSSLAPVPGDIKTPTR